jgi:DNA (cytosine-5)-methyltransferase 1
VPQSRERVIIIGVRKDLGIEPSHPKPQTNAATVEQAWRGLVNDPAEIEWLMDCGRRYAAYKPYPNMAQGTNGRFGDFYRMHPKKPARAIVKFAGVVNARSVMHPTEQRRPTVAEFKRIASFPDLFEFYGDWKSSVERIGNSVPPNLMRAIAEHIRREILKS